MKSSPSTENRHTRARQSALRQLAQVGPFLEGSLCPFQRPGCSQPGWHLTFKLKGRTQTLYVPMDLVAEVKTWTRNYQLLKQLVRKVTQASRALIRSHVARRRAAKPTRPPTRPSPPKA